MRKIPPESCSIAMFHAMREAIDSEAALTDLRQLRRINLGAARVAVHHLATTALVREVADDPREDVVEVHGLTPAARLLHDIEEEAADRRAERILRPVRSIANARTLIQAILQMPSRRYPNVTYESRISLDPPSIPGLIEQLSDPESLKAEGVEMGHCVANYSGRVAERKSLVFRVLSGHAPQISRATIEIIAGAHPTIWRLGQLKGVRNAPVSLATRSLVETWLRRVNENAQISVDELNAASLAAIRPPARLVA
jgi:hypothetical protein